VNRNCRWCPTLLLLVSGCALDLAGKDHCRRDDDCPTRICAEGRCAAERPPDAAVEGDAALLVVDAPREAACNPSQAPVCSGDGFEVCRSDGSGVDHTDCAGRGCLAGACCPPGEEVLGAACHPCGGAGQSCCRAGGGCRCAPELAQCDGQCLAVPATLCVRKVLTEALFAATFCELREHPRRFDCDTEKTRACGPPPGNSNILVYGLYHPAPAGRAEPEAQYWCCPGCRVATADEVAGDESCLKEKRKACAE
jgi:hypothetical protein